MKKLLCVIIALSPIWLSNLPDRDFLKDPVLSSEKEDRFKKLKEAFARAEAFLENMVWTKAASFPSENLVSFIKKQEGFRSRAYICAGGKVTIGYGFTSDDVMEGIRRGYLPVGYKHPQTMTEAQADEFLRTVAMPVYNEIVQEKVKVNLTQNQKEALISFTFNLGGGNLEKIAGQLNKGDYNVGERMKLYCCAKGKKLPGLVERRKLEAEMYGN